MLKIGQKAPEIRLKNQDSIEVNLAEYAGQWVIVYFYPKDNTPGCTQESCDFNQNHDFFRGIDTTILGISPDSPEMHTKFIFKYSFKFSLLCDESKKVLKAYGAWGLKKLYGKEYEGVIRSTFIIDPKGIVRATYNNIRVKGHIDTVIADLTKLQQEEE